MEKGQVNHPHQTELKTGTHGAQAPWRYADSRWSSHFLSSTLYTQWLSGLSLNIPFTVITLTSYLQAQSSKPQYRTCYIQKHMQGFIILQGTVRKDTGRPESSPHMHFQSAPQIMPISGLLKSSAVRHNNQQTSTSQKFVPKAVL